MTPRANRAAAAYDDLAEEYDRRWSVHVREPQERLTRDLQLAPGMRCADLGCGTGIDTLLMAKTVAPGEVIAVDLSAVMLQTVTARAAELGLTLSARCQDFTQFITHEPHASYDVLTLRFSLGYLDWRALLPQLSSLLKPGGRMGILTIMATSAQQAYAVYEQMASDAGVRSQPRTGPRTLAELVDGVRAGGAIAETSWVSSFRLHFATGEQMADFLRETGIASHPLIDTLPPEMVQLLWARFAQLVEPQRTALGLPLDFQLGGLIARRA